MRGPPVVRLLRVTVVVGAALTLSGSAMVAVVDGPGFWWSEYAAFSTLLPVFFALFVWMVIPRQPRNGVLWTMAASALCGGLYLSGWGAALAIDHPHLFSATSVVPATLSRAAARLMVVAGPAALGMFFPLLTFGLLLFPDGRLPSRRWRWVASLSGVGLGVFLLAGAWDYRPWNTAIAGQDAVMNFGGSLVLMAMVLSWAALLRRFRASRGQLREQFKWVVWGASLLVPVIIAGFFFGDTHPAVMTVPVTLAGGTFLASYGIAVGRFRLYDIDVVISRTFVYGMLAAFISGMYVLVVVGVGRLLGSASRPRPGLEIATMAAVAVVVQPVRRRLQWAANRIVYGKKATPYQVLSEFSHRVAATGDELLGQVARSLVEGTGARSAEVWVVIDGELVRAAEWPDGARSAEEEIGSFPIDQHGIELGRLTLAAPPGQRLDEEDRRLAGEMAAGMALALRNRRLTGALQSRIEELRVSRHRLVEVQDETRRKLERDLHDGTQQQLVALKIKLGLSRSLAEKEGGSRTPSLL
ncbi:MAG TPA: histidine kinase, partial [Longimicrobiales bacterium]|nr:histidine kinase [Longimicrobiales bacterium]